MTLSRRSLLGWLSALPFAGLLKRAEPEPQLYAESWFKLICSSRRGQGITGTVLTIMDARLEEAAEQGRTPLSFSLGSEALREFDDAVWDERRRLGISRPREEYLLHGKGADDHGGFEVRDYRGIPVEPAGRAALLEGEGDGTRILYVAQLADEECADPSLVHLHTWSSSAGRIEMTDPARGEFTIHRISEWDGPARTYE